MITILTDDAGADAPVPVVGMVHVHAGDQVIVSTARGTVIRVPADRIPVKGRAAQGNWIIRPKDGDTVASVARVPKEEEVEESELATPEETA